MWEFIDKIVYINLDNRQDRRDIMAKFFKEGQIPDDKIIRFSAIKHKRPPIGILQSHTEVLHMAKRAGWKNVLILEDDLQWINLESGYQQLLELISKPKWDVILLCGWYKEYDFPRIYSSLNTGAYLVNSDYYDTFLENRTSAIKSIVPKNIRQFLSRNNYSADMSWDIIMKRDMWFGLYPCICSQVDGQSDNSKKIINASLAVGIFSAAVRKTIWN